MPTTTSRSRFRRASFVARVEEACDCPAPDPRQPRSSAAARPSSRHAADLGEAQRLAKVGSWTWDAATDATTGSAELYRIFGLDPRGGPFPNFKAQDGTLYPHEELGHDQQCCARNDAQQQGLSN